MHSMYTVTLSMHYRLGLQLGSMLITCIIYSGTFIIRTPLGQKSVLIREVSLFQG